MWLRLTLLFTVGLIACAGEVSDSQQLAGAHSADPERMSAERDTAATEPEPAVDFGIDQSGCRLLPFDVRVRKLEAATGIDRSDAAFSGLLAASVELGAPNHAAGVAADLSWSANRIATWVRHIKPLCESPSFASYNTVEDLIARAYGREARPTDTEMLAPVLAEAGLNEAEQQHLVTCLAVLSSTEFVLQ